MNIYIYIFNKENQEFWYQEESKFNKDSENNGQKWVFVIG